MEQRQITGLTSRPELNGAVVEILGRDASTGRLRVRVVGRPELGAMALKRENLTQLSWANTAKQAFGRLDVNELRLADDAHAQAARRCISAQDLDDGAVQFGPAREARDLALFHLVCAAMLLAVHCAAGLVCLQEAVCELVPTASPACCSQQY